MTLVGGEGRDIVEGISLGHTFISSVIVRYSNQV